MQESTFYQAILARGEAKGRAEGEAEGRAHEAKASLLRIAERRFGAASPVDRAAIDSVNDLDQLHAWIDLVLEVPSWSDFWVTTRLTRAGGG